MRFHTHASKADDVSQKCMNSACKQACVHIAFPVSCYMVDMFGFIARMELVYICGPDRNVFVKDGAIGLKVHIAEFKETSIKPPMYTELRVYKPRRCKKGEPGV